MVWSGYDATELWYCVTKSGAMYFGTRWLLILFVCSTSSISPQSTRLRSVEGEALRGEAWRRSRVEASGLRQCPL